MLVSKLIERAFAKLAIQTSINELSDKEKEDAIEELNHMMRELEGDGIVIGWTPVSAVTDTITTPDWSWRMIYLRLAILISPEYGKTPSPLVINDHKSAYNTVQSQIQDHIDVALPPDMPMGGGNRGCRGSQNFVGNDSADNILTGNGDILFDQTNTTITREL